jgi:hypothetical protein
MKFKNLTTDRSSTDRNLRPARPSGADFWLLGNSFFQAASILHNDMKNSLGSNDVATPTTFLYLRSVELCCKACLPKSTYSDTTIMTNLGHDLSKLLDALSDSKILDNIRVHRNQFQTIDRFSNEYRDKWIEYCPGFQRIPDLDSLSDEIRPLLASTKQYIITNLGEFDS